MSLESLLLINGVFLIAAILYFVCWERMPPEDRREKLRRYEQSRWQAFFFGLSIALGALIISLVMDLSDDAGFNRSSGIGWYKLD